MYTMKKFSKFHLTALTLAGLMVVTTASVGAASVYKNITARQNTAMKDDDGDSLYPHTYDGNTYLPAEQLASAVGYNATSDDDSVSLTKKAAATSTSTSSTDIGAEKAKEIALQHAGVSASNAVFVKAEREYDDGRLTYDVDFYAGNKEYDYEILAADGTILSYDADIEGYRIPSAANASADIGVEKAKQIALQHAGVSASNAVFVKAEREYDDGRLTYDVDFYAGNKEYDYEILAADGTILSYDADIEGYYLPSSSKGATSTSSNRNASSSGLITRDRAKQIALEHAGLSSSDVNFVKAELDEDDGHFEYEIEFHHNFREYEYTIDAASGTILEAERD